MSGVDRVVYLDTSVLLPYHRSEPLSSLVEQWLSTLTAPVRISSLTEVEFASALSRVVRMQELSDGHATQITSLFEQECQDGLFYTMPLNNAHFEQAKMWLLSRATALRTLDALHLACSNSIGAKIVTADKILHTSAMQFDVPTQLIA